jgi:hypothetical protein
MGNTQSNSFQRALADFVTNNFFLKREQFIERAFLEAFHRLHLSYQTDRKNFAKKWVESLEESINQIYSVRAEVEQSLDLLKKEQSNRKLYQNRIFGLVMDKCHGDLTFSLSCWDSKTSSWSNQKIQTFFRFFSDVLMELFLSLFDGSVMRPNLLNLPEFHRHFDVRMEIEGNNEYNACTQKTTLIQMLLTTIESTCIRYHYPKESEMQDSSYLSATNGTRVYVRNWFVRELDQYWIDLLLICGSNAVSKQFSHEALVEWRTTGKRIEQ